MGAQNPEAEGKAKEPKDDKAVVFGFLEQLSEKERAKILRLPSFLLSLLTSLLSCFHLQQSDER